MKDKNTMNRLNAAMKAFEKLLQEQEEEKESMLSDEYEDDDTDLIEDMLLEISDLLHQAAELSAQAAMLIGGEDIEADRCIPRCCTMEVYFDDEL